MIRCRNWMRDCFPERSTNVHLGTFCYHLHTTDHCSAGNSCVKNREPCHTHLPQFYSFFSANWNNTNSGHQSLTNRSINIVVFCFFEIFESLIQKYALNGLKLMASISPAKIKVKCLFKLPKKPGIMKFLCPHKMNTNFKLCCSLSIHRVFSI